MPYICPERIKNRPLPHNHNIPFHKPTYTGEEQGCIQAAIASGNWAQISEESKLFFNDYYPSSPCFFTNSCSSALEMAVRALDIGPGDEVIIPGFSYVALANAVVNNGAVPVFADVEFPSGNIDLQSAAACITSRTRALIALHYAGNACNITGLVELCNRANIYLIEDAAQCIGSSYDSKPLGSFGQIGCLSFDYMKNITCGQGGLLVVNDRSLVKQIQTGYDNGTDRYALLNGTQKFFEWVGKGTNYQINPVASYFLAAQLRAIKPITQDRIKKWKLYDDLLRPLADRGKVILNGPEPTHNGHIFYLVTASEKERDNLRRYLREKSIFAEHHYSSLALSPFGKQFASSEREIKNSEQLCRQLLRLPLWYRITEDQIGIVASTISSFYDN
jgi:dTDP-4-amino-4,6-dideoxygalactose transaminase